MKTTFKTLALLIAFTANYYTSFGQKQEVLLIGTFHYNNPNFDAVKTDAFDVLGDKSQRELEQISDKIKQYNPDKIFVEWNFDKQAKLDSLYQLYLDGKYDKFIKEKYKNADDLAFYKENEIFQLAFRAAKKSNLAKVNGIDYYIDLPFDTVMNSIKSAKQKELMNEINAFVKKSGEEANLKRKTMSLTELMLDLNTPAARKANAGFYLKAINKAGSNESFAGAYSVSEWYRRNLYMYSLVQKLTQSTDKKIVILLGSGHISMIKEFINLEDKFKIVELKDVLK
ncbi:DUF5694 domain-containing protein [Pedobacter aquatilis]|uniref:DUF5694 domain-containing protein n=1 Tax=Pedobacter aquatilis TaxID=351343 RepID=UPI0025B42C75|nr:DUF5694 domain-containing protein [Pedobacter aquatilis]MDN3586337.1 DUF5694 domain-containing protein [Pedobacter aquatilis]